MTPPINSVSPERLDELARWAASEEAECLQDDMPISAGYYADIIKLIAARRAANTPVDGWVMGADSAPRDGTAILVWPVEPYEYPSVVRWYEPWGVWLKPGEEPPMPSDERYGMGAKVPAYWQYINKPATSASPALPSQVVGAVLTAYELQVLLGTSISGCNMEADRTFDLPAAWARLKALGLIDRADGLAIATDKGLARIQACLTSPAAEPGEDKLDRLIDFIIGPSVSDADYDADAERDLAIDEGRYTIADELRDLQQSIMQCRTLEDLRAVQITVQHIRTHPAPSASREVTE